MGRGRITLLPADNTTTLLALHTTPRPNILVEDKSVNNPHPTAVTRKRLVEITGNLMQLVQLRPRDSGEVMVLVMQSNIVGEDVEGTVVRVCFRRRKGIKRVRLFDPLSVLQLCQGLCAAVLDLGEKVVLCDEVACAGVQGSCQERAHQEVEDGLEGAAELGKDVVEGYLHGYVHEVDVGKGRAVDEHWADGIEEDLEGAEEGLA